jgi:PAS domain S-box-containing protein
MHLVRPDDSTEPPRSRSIRAVMTFLCAAVVLPLVTFVVQSLIWPLLSPSAWILFAFTVFVSAWIGGAWSGVCATVVSTGLVWWAFLPPEHSFHVDTPRYVVSAAVFVLVGLLCSALQGRLRRAIRDAASALASARSANERLHEVVNERRVFAALVNNSADFIGISDPDGKPVYVNPAGRRMVGLPDECQIEGTQINEYYPPDLRSFVTDVVLKTMMDHGAWQGETYFRNWQSGERIPVSNSCFLIRDPETGGVLGTGTITRDVSDVRRARQAVETANAKLAKANVALRTSEAKFSGLVAVASDAIVSIDADQRIVIYNEGAERIFGWKAQEVLGEHLDILIPERFRADHRRHVADFAAEATRARKVGEGSPIFGLRKGGEEFPAVAAISKLDLDGASLFTVVLRDVTAEKRRQDEQRFLAEVGSALALTLDYEDTLTNVSRIAVRNLADFCAVDVVGDDGSASRLRVVSRDPSQAWICDFFLRSPLDRSHPYLLWSVLESGRPVVFSGLPPGMRAVFAEDPHYREVLRAIDVHAVMSVPLLAHGKPFGAMTFVSSTPSREYGPDDVRLAEELAVRAALAIENARLYREAQRAVQARDEVLAIVAHDLRNPLNCIVMQTQLLGRSGSEPERRSQTPVQALRRSALRMNRLIDDLLDVSRIEAGRLPIEPTRVSAVQIVSESVEAQRPLAASESLELGLDAAAAETLPDVWADRERLLQVFENLIGNAVKFAKPGNRITVGAAPGQGEDVFWVSDTGPGISAEELPHLFDRFWQARKTGRHGAGLGLPIVKGIVEAHGGRVWVESASGRGTTVSFTIPAYLRRAGPGTGAAAGP